MVKQRTVNPRSTGSTPVTSAIGGKRSHDPRTNATECTSRSYGLLELTRTYCGGRSRMVLDTGLWCQSSRVRTPSFTLIAGTAALAVRDAHNHHVRPKILLWVLCDGIWAKGMPRSSGLRDLGSTPGIPAGPSKRLSAGCDTRLHSGSHRWLSVEFATKLTKSLQGRYLAMGNVLQ